MIAPYPKVTLPLPGRLLFACLAMGFAALVAQVVLTRELLGLFYGNELSVALALAVWLVLVASGSALGSRLGGNAAARTLGWSQLATATLLPISLLLARRAQPGAVGPGQVLGPGAMLLVSLQTLAPVCLLLGVQFVAAVRASTRSFRRGRHAAVSPAAWTYALESAGSVAGGLAFHAWAAQHMMPFATVAVVSLLLLASACVLLRLEASPLGRAGVLALSGALACGLVFIGARSLSVELWTLRRSPRWSSVHPIAAATSRYGPLVVAERAGQVSLYQSGILLFTSQDEYVDECAVHLPLLEHPAPRRVLILGGDLAGLAQEALKHGVSRVDCLELDPSVLELAQRWFPSSSLHAMQDPRVRLHIGDGRVFVRQAHGVYDAVVVNLPDPTTAAINRFYTVGFFEEVRRALAPDGVFAIGLTGSDAQLAGPAQLAAATVDRTLAAAFPDQLIIPGGHMLFLAAGRASALTSDWGVLSNRLARRGIHADFVNAEWLRDALLPFRAELTRQTIGQVANPPLNTDLNPVSYYHQTRVWLAQLSPWLSGPAQLLSRVSVWWAPAAFPLAALIAGLSRGTRRRTAAIIVAAATVGAFGIAMEVAALLLLQSACGYLYYAMAMLMAAFMAGLAVGALLPVLHGTQRAASERSLSAVLAMAVGAALVMCGLAPVILHHPQWALPVLAAFLLCSGCLVGAAYPVLTHLYGRGRDASAAAGAIYALDLVGSAGASLLAGLVAVPLLGLTGASLATAICLAAALLLTLVSLRG